MGQIDKLHKEIGALLAERELIDAEIQQLADRILELEPRWSWPRVQEHFINTLGNPLTWALAWIVVAIWMLLQ